MITIDETIFRLGHSCPNKVAHLRAGLPRSDENDPFVKWMSAESGKVRALARHYFPDAVDIPKGDEGVAYTRALLESGGAVAGAAFATGSAKCHVDFAAREASTIRIYHVVPKAIDLTRIQQRVEFTGQNGRIRSEWWQTMETMAFKLAVVQACWPQYRIIPLFIAPVKDAMGRIDGFHEMFEETPLGWRTTHPSAIAEATNLVRQFCVATECAPLVDAVAAKVARLRTALENPPPPNLSYACKKCEFNVPDSGFDQCWGSLNDSTPSAWRMPWLYFIEDPSKPGVPIFNRIVREKKSTSLWDIPVELIKGEHAPRQLLHLECTASNREIIKPELAAEIDRLEFPLHFLDIEALRTVIPPHKGARVNGLTFFQFSRELISEPGAEPIHTEFLDSGEGNPNRRFLKALRAALGDHGSCLCWSAFEESSFREFRDEMLRTDGYDEDVHWLDRLLVGGRLIDQYALCLKHYIHPKCGGRASIKAVLPAVWSEDTPGTVPFPFEQFPRGTDPYAFLKESGGVADGVASMAAYFALLTATGAQREKIRREMLLYTAVDSSAQVLIWRRWLHLLGNLSANVAASIALPPIARAETTGVAA